MDEGDEKSVVEEANTEEIEDKAGPKRGGPQFIPSLLNKKISIRLNDGRPVTGTLRGFNPYEILIEMPNKKQMIIFKHAITSIESQENSEKQSKPAPRRW